MAENQEGSGPSLSRLNGMVLDTLQATNRWVTPHEIIAHIKNKHGLLISDSSCTARIRDLRKEKCGYHVIVKRKRIGAKAFEYRLADTDYLIPSVPASANCSANGAELIAAERQRQIKVEGWTPEHDDAHTHNELAFAAMVYIDESTIGMPIIPYEAWPWSRWQLKLTNPIRNLVKAGALIAAEIDRLQRKGGKQ